MGTDSWLLIGKLRRALKKIRFLMNFNLNRLRLASAIGSSSSKHRLSFNERPGLMACTEDTDSNDSGYSPGLQRTISFPAEDDIDKRADMFIANFHRQLQIERQISLKLRYCRATSFELASP